MILRRHIHIGSPQLTHIPSGNQGYCTDPHISLLQKLHNHYRLFMICFRKRILKRRPTVTQGLSPHFLRSVDVSQCHIVKILKYFRTDIVKTANPCFFWVTSVCSGHKLMCHQHISLCRIDLTLLQSSHNTLFISINVIPLQSMAYCRRFQKRQKIYRYWSILIF